MAESLLVYIHITQLLYRLIILSHAKKYISENLQVGMLFFTVQSLPLKYSLPLKLFGCGAGGGGWDWALQEMGDSRLLPTPQQGLDVYGSHPTCPLRSTGKTFGMGTIIC